LPASHARDVAIKLQQTFQFLWRKVADSYLATGMCSQGLLNDYEEAKQNLLTAHEVINNYYEKQINKT
jgi:hypothetical protein